MFPNFISAVTFSSDGVNYVLEELQLNCSLNEHARLVQKTKDYYILSDYSIDKEVEIFYKLDFNNNCSVLDSQGILDLYTANKADNYYSYSYKLKNNKIIKSQQNLLSYREYEIKTTDKNINSEKEYYVVQRDEDNGPSFIHIQDPQVSNIDNYYEKIWVTSPTSVIIDNNITYYEIVASTDTIPMHL